ncbi:MAG TPA: hypothetical protein VMU51_04240 [Mycobacteriales bacterium]|nr:hypothetical protein [Mycobacteriales bacterium]
MPPVPTPTPPTAAPPTSRRRTRTAGPPGTAALATVWPHDPQNPQATLAALLAAYTDPGDRVVLLTPPGPASLDAGTDWTAQLARRGPALARLRRRIQVRTDRPDHRPPTGPAHDDRGPAPESGPGSGPGPATPTNPPDPRSPTGPDTVPAGGTAPAGTGPDTGRRPANRTGTGVDRAELVVTAVDPHAPDWVARPPWTNLLTRSGLLAAITHSDRRGGRWVDPLPALAAVLTAAGLVWHDRIVLHHQPSTGRSTVDRAAASRAELGPTVGHERVHTDLLLFAPQPRLTRAGGRSGGRGGRDA